MAEMLGNGGGPGGRSPEVTPLSGPVVSTSCLVVVLVAAFIALVVLPLALWLLGIACGAS